MRLWPLQSAGIFFAAILMALSGCERGQANADGGGADGNGSDGGNLIDAFVGGLSVDFAIANCPTTTGPDAGVAPGCCRGPAPLTLTLVPITAGPIDRYFWQFGDETTSNLPAPVHTYALPNRYDVTLVAGGAAGTLSLSKPACVEATTNPIGAPCDVDLQCSAGATCVCGAAAECASPFVRGICSTSCRDANCVAPSVCGDLSSGAATAETPWQQPLCLAPCQVDADCAAGLRCRSLPSRYPAGGWVRACFVAYPLSVGSPCRNARGQWESAACVSGLCANRGALGQCALDCSNRACPEGSACAAFANGDKLCTPVCSSRLRCTDDPLLTCQMAGGGGPLAFAVPGAVASTAYCVPRTCQSDAECPGARCVRESDASGRCQVDPP